MALNDGVYETGRPADVDPSNVTTRDDVVAIVTGMLHDLRRYPDAWENSTLERFLDALAAVVDGVELANQHRGETLPTEPTWRLFGEILVAACGYE